MDRVFELGDASVPFPFDVHAMIYSEDAPTLEYTLHNKLSEHRVNLVNDRKEFFKVSLDVIEAFSIKHGLKIEFTKVAEAREFHETKTRRESGRLASTVASERPMSVAAGRRSLEDD
jgi:hypothetical protein